jgi:hypothetical protein
MDAAKNVTATFTINKYPLAESNYGSGTDTTTPAGINFGGTCSASLDYYTGGALTPVAASGASCSSWRRS